MLPPETQDRILDVIPDVITVDYRLPVATPDGGQTTETHTADVPLTVREQRQDTPPRGDYPLAAVAFDPTTVSWTPGQRLPDTHHTEPVLNDPTVAYREFVGEDVYDQLNIVIAVADGIDTDADGRNEIPKSVVAKKLAQQVYAAFLLGTDHLNDPATIDATDEYVWPVLVTETRGEGVTRLPATERQQPIARYAMQFNCRYTLTESRLVEAVEAIEYTAETRTQAGDALATRVTDTVDLIHGFGEGRYGIGEYGW